MFQIIVHHKQSFFFFFLFMFKIIFANIPKECSDSSVFVTGFHHQIHFATCPFFIFLILFYVTHFKFRHQVNNVIFKKKICLKEKKILI